jgi:nucleotide-binding universal stress UspA family protein
MSIFPTKILLATDGSEDAELAATTAVGLARSTASELQHASASCSLSARCSRAGVALLTT